MSTSFCQWATEWECVRESVQKDPPNDLQAIIAAWGKRVPRCSFRDLKKMEAGYRKTNMRDRGEQIIERALLATKGGIAGHLIKSGKKEYPMVAIHHSVYLTKFKEGQVIADALAAVFVDGHWHPLVIEVKNTAQDPLCALVQNLQQVRLLRAQVRRVLPFVKVSDRGVWGMVLAPPKYFEQHKDCLGLCRKLLSLLKQTQARVILAKWDNQLGHPFEVVCGNWR